MSKKKAVVQKNKITCVSGPLAEMNSIVKDKQGTEWYSMLTEDQFKLYKDDYGVQVYDQGGYPTKKYLKGFLTYISVFALTLNNKPVEKIQSMDNVMRVKLGSEDTVVLEPDAPAEEIAPLILGPEDPNIIVEDPEAPEEPEAPETAVSDENSTTMA
jgi:hypothetical protein